MTRKAPTITPLKNMNSMVKYIMTPALPKKSEAEEMFPNTPHNILMNAKLNAATVMDKVAMIALDTTTARICVANVLSG